MLCGLRISSASVKPLTRVNTRFPLRMIPFWSVVEKNNSSRSNGRSTFVG